MVTVKVPSGFFALMSPIKAVFRAPRIITTENIETENRYLPFREWRIPVLLYKLFYIYMYNTTKHKFFQQSHPSLMD